MSDPARTSSRERSRPGPWRPAPWALLVWTACGAPVFGGPVPDGAQAAPPAITVEMLDEMPRLPGGLGPLPAVPVPADNPQSEAKIALGRILFFDARLSLDRVQSCASCHDPRKGFSDGRPRAVGLGGAELSRRSPTVLNAAYSPRQFWDGRAASLEEQAQGPLLAASEMGMGSAERVAARLETIPGYVHRFQAVFGERPTLADAAKAIAAFERTLVTPESPFDAYARGNKHALSDSQKRGLILFIGKAACVQCHNGPCFSDGGFHRLGMRRDAAHPQDPGRFAVTRKEDDRGAFKTPTLRNVSARAPYMHDGALGTLREVVDFYDRGGDEDEGKSPLVFALELTPGEKADLVAFLRSLTGASPLTGSAPARDTKRGQN